jgi:glycosyltransferase involved in cell wall biosynthesis
MDSVSLPKISIVTPSYNQGQFLEETIQSVINQKYPNLEYIIMDGGSTDNSIEIIKQYESHIAHWESGPDGGQANAINMGFSMATGDILGWLNSDDYYLPGVFDEVIKVLHKDDLKIVFGNCIHFYEDGRRSSRTRYSMERFERFNIEYCDFIEQPSSFWTRKAFEKTGILETKLNFGFDWDWFIRAKRKGIEFVPLGKDLSAYRFHDAHKSGSGGKTRTLELASIYRKHHSENIADTYLRIEKMKSLFDLTEKLQKLATILGIVKFINPYRFLFPFYARKVTWEAFKNMVTMI